MEVIAATETWLDGQPSEFFLSGLRTLEHSAKECIELRGEYVGLVPVACFLPDQAKDLPAPHRTLEHQIFTHLCS